MKQSFILLRPVDDIVIAGDIDISTKIIWLESQIAK